MTANGSYRFISVDLSGPLQIMDIFQVTREINLKPERRFAVVTVIGFSASVRKHVMFESVSTGQTDPAILIGAFMGPKTSVHLHMAF